MICNDVEWSNVTFSHKYRSCEMKTLIKRKSYRFHEDNSKRKQFQPNKT